MSNRNPTWPALGIGLMVVIVIASVNPGPALGQSAGIKGPLTLESAEGRGEDLAPYVPTPMDVVDEMLKLADIKSTDVVYDLGCGDGRIVIRAAEKYGAKGIGVDFNPVRIREAKERAKEYNVQGKVKFILGDVMKVDFSSATAVCIYLLPSSNAKLQPIFEKQLPVGARVVSHDFSMPEPWEEVERKRVESDDNRMHTLYMWVITPEMKERAAAREKLRPIEAPM
jgi:SAM-dependent methyltransferase